MAGINPRLANLFRTFRHGADYNYEQWLAYPEILADDFRLMQDAHCNVMSVGIFSWAMLEPAEGQYDFAWMDRLLDELAAHDIGAILATPSAAPPAWLSQKYPETRRVDGFGRREPHKERQNFCYTSPVYREKVQQINRQLAERYQTHPALLLWHVSNEYGGTQCHCDLCYQAFRTWLKQRYGDLDSLNQAWWTTFWSHRYTDWDQIEPVDISAHGLMLDWQRFTSDQALDFFKAETVPLKAITPEIPITTNFMRPDVALDYWRFAEHLDVISWDSYPRWHQGNDAQTGMHTAFYHDLHRSYKQGQPFLLMESSPSVTNWQGVSRLKQPGAHKLTSLQAVAHGSNSVQYFQWRQSRGGQEKFHGAVLSHLNTAETRVFRDVREVGMILETLGDILPASTPASVAVLYDFENEWALNHAQLPRSLGKQYPFTCQQHYGAFWQRGVSVDVINARAVLDGYTIVVAPMLYSMPTGLAERIEAFVQAGGIFITTYLTGMVDESDLCFLNGYPPALRRTLGLYSEELDTMTDEQHGTISFNGDSYRFKDYAELVHTETASTLAAYSSEFYAGYPAITVNNHGSGKAYFIAARTDEALLADFYGGVLAEAGITGALPTPLPAGVTAQVRETDQQRFVFVMNFTAHAQQVALGDAPFTDVVSGRAVTSPLALQPYDMHILWTPTA